MDAKTLVTYRKFLSREPHLPGEDIPPPTNIGSLLTIIRHLCAITKTREINILRPWMPYAAQPVCCGSAFVIVNRSYAPLGQPGGQSCDPAYWYEKNVPKELWLPATEIQFPVMRCIGGDLVGWFFQDSSAPWDSQFNKRLYIGLLVVSFGLDRFVIGDYSDWEPRHIPNLWNDWRLPIEVLKYAEDARKKVEFVSGTEYGQ